MSRPPAPADLVRALKRWGVDAVPVTKAGQPWYRHTSAGSWSDIHGIVNHHTGPYATVGGMLALLWSGRVDLPGPLCHQAVAPNGRVYLLSHGNANHAGAGDPDVYRAVVGESYTTRPPAPDTDSVDGNSRLVGVEVLHPGDDSPYPAAQIRALVRLNAAWCQLQGWGPKSCIQHYEWTRRKIDMSWRGPKGGGDDLRTEIARALAQGPAYTFPPRTAEPAEPAPSHEVWAADIPPSEAFGRTWDAATHLRHHTVALADLAEQVRQLRDQLNPPEVNP